MRRMELTVNSARVYGKVLHRGDIFEVPEKEAQLWGALARAKPAKKNEYQTANVTADDEAHPRRQRKNSYSRRDMRAEDE